MSEISKFGNVFYDFLNSIKEFCIKNGIEYNFPDTPKVSYPGQEEMKVSGFFDDTPRPIIACAIGKPEYDWAQILVHESCHMDQWMEDSEFWKGMKSGDIPADKVMDEWLYGKDFEMKVVEESIDTLLKLELDCEIRSAKKIIDMNLPINIDNYVKGANAYLYFYPIMLKTRKWCDKAPYEVSDIFDVMPNTFLNAKEYYLFSSELLEIYKKECYK